MSKTNICCPLMLGTVGQTTINQANIAQALVTTSTMVRSFTVYPDPNNTGNVLMSYGGAPLLPALAQSPVPGQWYDLAMVQVKSTVANDKVNWNAIYTP